MNDKHAKALRAQARLETAGRPERAYTTTPHGIRRVVKLTTRGRYLTLKRRNPRPSTTP
jgi:hypothetical protein